MRPKWPKRASPAQKICTIRFQFFDAFFASKGYPFRNISTFCKLSEVVNSIETASATSVESDLGCTSKFYFDTVTLTPHNMTLTSQKTCQYNYKIIWKNKFDCNETNRYNIPRDAINIPQDAINIPQDAINEV